MSEIEQLARDLEQAGETVLKQVQAVVSKGALNIKNDWRAAWSGLKHAPDLPKAISYEVNPLAHGLQAVIGPDKAKRQGALGNLLEFGSVHNAPHPAGQQALDREEPRFLAAIEAITGDIL